MPGTEKVITMPATERVIPSPIRNPKPPFLHLHALEPTHQVPRDIPRLLFTRVSGPPHPTEVSAERHHLETKAQSVTLHRARQALQLWPWPRIPHLELHAPHAAQADAQLRGPVAPGRAQTQLLGLVAPGLAQTVKVPFCVAEELGIRLEEDSLVREHPLGRGARSRAAVLDRVVLERGVLNCGVDGPKGAARGVVEEREVHGRRAEALDDEWRGQEEVVVDEVAEFAGNLEEWEGGFGCYEGAASRCGVYGPRAF